MNGKPTATAYDALGAFSELGVEYIGSESDREVSIHCPLHDDQTPSCRVTTLTGVWYCDPCAEGGAFPKLLTALGVRGMDHGLILGRFGRGQVEVSDGIGRHGSGETFDPNWVVLPGKLSPSPDSARYEYEDASGVHVATVHRDGKSFPVQHRRGWPKRADGLEMVWGHPNTWVLYHLPEVLRAVKAGETVYLCEGEKDADAMREVLGVTATTCAGGARRWDRTDTHPLDDADVVIVADRDAPGLAYAVGLARNLRRWGSTVTIVGSAAGKDAADHIENGFGVDDFIEWSEPVTREPSDQVDKATRPKLLSYADAKVTADEYVIRGVLPKGALSILAGDGGLGKSTTVLSWVTDLSHRGINVMLLSLEDGEGVIRKRLQAAGARMECVHHFDLTDFEDIDQDMPMLIELLEESRSEVLILDALNDFLPDKVDSNQDKPARRALKRLRTYCGKSNLAVLALHHITKDEKSDPVNRLQGNAVYKNLPRNVMGFGVPPKSEDPENERALVLIKGNLDDGRLEGALLYRREMKDVVIDDKVYRAAVSTYVGTDPTITKDNLLWTTRREKNDGAMAEARDFLDFILTTGPMAAKDVLEIADEDKGLNKNTIKKVRREMGILSKKFGKSWYWARTDEDFVGFKPVDGSEETTGDEESEDIG